MSTASLPDTVPVEPFDESLIKLALTRMWMWGSK